MTVGELSTIATELCVLLVMGDLELGKRGGFSFNGLCADEGLVGVGDVSRPKEGDLEFRSVEADGDAVRPFGMAESATNFGLLGGRGEGD